MPSRIWGGATGGAAANCRSVTISGNGGGTAPKSTAMSTCSATQNLHHQAVIMRRRKLVAIVLLTVIGGAIAFWLMGEKEEEPEFQGRSLSEWFEQDSKEAQAGVRNIGTNALPY